MRGYYILDDNDDPVCVDSQTYHDWHSKLSEVNRTGLGFTLAKTESCGVCVSTVYLGSDHGYGSPVPVLWETMVFCEGEADENCERSTSRIEALKVHQRFVEEYIVRPIETKVIQ
jgi:hypothetical protein